MADGYTSAMGFALGEKSRHLKGVLRFVVMLIAGLSFVMQKILRRTCIMSLCIEAAFKLAKGDTPSLPVQILTDAYNLWRNTVSGRKLSKKATECMDNLVKQAEISDGTKTADVPQEVIDELKAEVSQLITEHKKLVYMGCVDFICGVPLSEEQISSLKTAFSEDVVWEDDDYNELQSEIRSFLGEYATFPAFEDDDFSITEDSISVNFSDNMLYSEEDMRKFADTLNKFIDIRYPYITQFILL